MEIHIFFFQGWRNSKWKQLDWKAKIKKKCTEPI